MRFDIETCLFSPRLTKRSRLLFCRAEFSRIDRHRCFPRQPSNTTYYRRVQYIILLTTRTKTAPSSSGIKFRSLLYTSTPVHGTSRAIAKSAHDKIGVWIRRSSDVGLRPNYCTRLVIRSCFRVIRQKKKKSRITGNQRKNRVLATRLMKHIIQHGV